MSSLSLPSPLRRRWFFLRTEIDRLLTVSTLFSCALVAIRIIHSGRLTFLSMIWNLFLAYIPYAISSVLTRFSLPAVIRAAVLFCWLLFIPNSFYILTDLYHLADGHRNSRVPEWFDLALILSFAWNGLLPGILSTRHIEKLLAPNASATGQWFFLYPVMWLNALGVYIGRYLRYNSWDIVTNPFDLLSDIFSMIFHPFRYQNAWSMIFCYSVLLTLIYILIKKASKALT